MNDTNISIQDYSEIVARIKDPQFSNVPHTTEADALNLINILGYKIVSKHIDHADSHFVCDVVRDDAPEEVYIFKVNTKPEIASRTLVEISAMTQMQNQFSEEFIVPKAIDYGMTKNNVWFVREKLGGTPISGTKSEEVLIMAKATVQMMRSNLSIPHKDAPRIALYSNDVEARIKLMDKIYNLAESWSSQRDGLGKNMVRFIKEYPIADLSIKGIPTHGELIPKHILKLADGKYGIIDWELAAGQYFWYDPAYTFHRLWTAFKGYGNPDSAIQYLENLMSMYTTEELTKFKKTFKPMLAQRIIGGYFDYKDHDSINFKDNVRLEEAVVNGKFNFNF